MRTHLLVLSCLVAVAVTQDAALQQFGEGNRKFTAAVYKQLLKAGNANFVFSPLSAEIILALTQAGANGKTAQEFITSLSLPESQEVTQQAIKQLTPHLSKNEENLKLLSANKLFLGKDFTISDSFQRIATDIYKASADNVDFSKNVDAANTINKWVESNTNNKIRDLIKPDSLDSLTRLVLVNALYFSGKWINPFEKFATRKEKFFTSNTESVDVDMMHLEDSFNYYECTKHNVKYLELKYQGGVSMVIILPNEKEGLAKVEENLEEILTQPNFTYERVAVTLPKFRVDTDIALKPILQELGLKEAFTRDADFKGISDKEELYISDVVQKAFISVDESGTEAAAATAVVVALTSALLPDPTPPKIFNADHQFIYFLKHENVILFFGKIKKL